MSRDYAKKNSSRKKTKKTHLFVWLILLTLFTAFISYLFLAKKQKTTKAQTTTKFTFYKILSPAKTDNTKNLYQLEIAIKDNFADADNLKAKLILSGFTTKIKPFRQRGKQKYRISIGPYTDKNKALADQKKLKRNKISSALKKITR